MGYLTMAIDVCRVDPGLRTEKRYEPFESGQLPLRRPALFEVADQADPDSVVVEVVVLSPGAEVAPALALAVCAGDLPPPA
jgi:hypothetical protein